jgi:hypothetical protein
MKEERFNQIITQYGYALKVQYEKKGTHVSKESYLPIVMRSFALICFENDDIKDVNVGKPYSITKSKREVAEIFSSISYSPTTDKNDLGEFIDYLVGNEFPVVQNFKIEFKEKDSNLEIILKKK